MTTILFLAGWALRSSILIFGGALLLRMLRVKDPSVRLAAWIAMLCGSLLIPALTSALPGMPFHIMRTSPPVEAPVAVELVDSPSVRIIPPGNVRERFDWPLAGGHLYVVVAVALLLRLSIGLAMSLRLLGASRSTGRTDHDIEIRESDRVATPVTLGILHPAIVLPSDWSQWDAAKLDAVLAHEWSHIQRRDPAVQLLSGFHRAVLWHSPLAWFLHRRIVRVAEEASDDAAIAATCDRASYAEILLDFMQRGSRNAGVPGVPMARYGRADERINRILDGTSVSRGVTRWGVAAIVALGSPLAYVAAAAHPASPHPLSPQQSAPRTQPAIAQSPASRLGSVYLDALGGVAATTVTVKPRIDGLLLSVSFREGETVQAGQLLASIDPRPYEIQLAQAEGQLAGLTPPGITQAQLDGSFKAAQASVDRARLQLSYVQIHAPISGVAGLRQVDPSNVVYAAADATPIVIITQLQPVAVVFNLPEDLLPRVQARLKQSVSLQAEAWNRDMTVKIATGRLTAIDNQIDPTTGTVKLKAMFDNQDRALFPNEFVNVRLLVGAP